MPVFAVAVIVEASNLTSLIIIHIIYFSILAKEEKLEMQHGLIHESGTMGGG